MENELPKEVIIDHFGIKEGELNFEDPCNFHMSLGDCIDIAQEYGERISDKYPLR